MKRLALITAIIAVLLLVDGAYLQLTNNEVGGDSGVLFGNPNIVISAGTVVLVSGGLVLLGAGLMWVVALRRERAAAGIGQASQPKAGDAQTIVAAAQAQTDKGQEHQRQP
jgi:hypothetical protein